MEAAFLILLLSVDLALAGPLIRPLAAMPLIWWRARRARLKAK